MVIAGWAWDKHPALAASISQGDLIFALLVLAIIAVVVWIVRR